MSFGKDLVVAFYLVGRNSRWNRAITPVKCEGVVTYFFPPPLLLGKLGSMVQCIRSRLGKHAAAASVERGGGGGGRREEIGESACWSTHCATQKVGST